MTLVSVAVAVTVRVAVPPCRESVCSASKSTHRHGDGDWDQAGRCAADGHALRPRRIGRAGRCGRARRAGAGQRRGRRDGRRGRQRRHDGRCGRRVGELGHDKRPVLRLARRHPADRSAPAGFSPPRPPGCPSSETACAAPRSSAPIWLLTESSVPFLCLGRSAEGPCSTGARPDERARAGRIDRAAPGRSDDRVLTAVGSGGRDAPPLVHDPRRVQSLREREGPQRPTLGRRERWRNSTSSPLRSHTSADALQSERDAIGDASLSRTVRSRTDAKAAPTRLPMPTRCS